MKNKPKKKLSKMFSNLFCKTRPEPFDASYEEEEKKSQIIVSRKRNNVPLRSRFYEGRSSYSKGKSKKKRFSRSKKGRGNNSAYSLKNTFAGSFCKKNSSIVSKKNLSVNSKNSFTSKKKNLSISKKKANIRQKTRKKLFKLGGKGKKSRSRMKSCSEVFEKICKKVESDKKKKEEGKKKIQVSQFRQQFKKNEKSCVGLLETFDKEKIIGDKDISEIAYLEPSSRFLDDDTCGDILLDLKLSLKEKKRDYLFRSPLKKIENRGKDGKKRGLDKEKQKFDFFKKIKLSRSRLKMFKGRENQKSGLTLFGKKRTHG